MNTYLEHHMTTLDTLLTAYAASPTKANRDAIAALFSPAHVNLAELTAEIATLKACLLKREQSLIDAKKALDAATVQPAEIDGELANAIMDAPCNWKGDPAMFDAILMGHTMACEQGAILAMKHLAASSARHVQDALSAADWLRNNYQDYANIGAICDALAARTAAPAQPTDLSAELRKSACFSTPAFNKLLTDAADEIERLARAAAPVSASLQLTSEQIAAKWKEEWSKLGLRADLPDAFLNLARALIANAAPVSGPTDTNQVRANFEDWYVTHIDGAQIGSADCAARWSTWLAVSSGHYKARDGWKIAPMPWSAPAEPVSGQGAPLLWALQSLSGEIVYQHTSRDNVAMNQSYVKTPTTIVGLGIIDSHPRSEDSPEWNGSNHAEMIQASKDFANGWKSALARNEDNRADALSRALYVIYPAIERDDLRTIIEAALVSNGYDEPLASATPPKGGA